MMSWLKYIVIDQTFLDGVMDKNAAFINQLDLTFQTKAIMSLPKP